MANIQKRVVREVVAVDASASCAEAARLMADRGIGSVGVLRAGRLVGILTERDLVARVVGISDPHRTTVGEAMRADLPAVSAQATDRECAQLMRTRHTRHLAVRERDQIVGVISMLDLVGLVVEEKQWDIDQLESYIRGGRSGQLSQPLTTVFGH